LSAPAAGIPSASTGAGDWFVLVDATDLQMTAVVLAQLMDEDVGFQSAVISNGTYRLMWDLSKTDIPA